MQQRVDSLLKKLEQYKANTNDLAISQQHLEVNFFL